MSLVRKCSSPRPTVANRIDGVEVARETESEKQRLFWCHYCDEFQSSRWLMHPWGTTLETGLGRGKRMPCTYADEVQEKEEDFSPFLDQSISRSAIAHPDR